jgi:DnaK suppressor protein
MSQHLTAGQRALMRAELERRQHELDRRLAEHQGGQSRADHARELMTQDFDDAPQRGSDREFDLAMSDFELRELGEVSAALRRIDTVGYGRCEDCDAEIPFDRLRVEPWALRCVSCEAAHERRWAPTSPS